MSGSERESRTVVAVERVSFLSDRPFDDVVEDIYSGLGHTGDFGGLLASWGAAADVAEFDALTDQVSGSSGLIEFLTLDLGDVLAKRLPGRDYRMLRIIAGNPVTMSKMTASLPDACSYAPLTILVAERPDGVYLAYDTVSSPIAPYGIAEASAVARDLDAAVLRLLREAATG